MIKGILLGAASAAALAALFMTSVSLLLPPPGASNRPSVALPSAPVLRDQAEVAPRVPDRPAVPVDVATTTAPSAAPQATTPPSRTTSQVPAPASVDLPSSSQFNRPPEDGVAVTPEIETNTRPTVVSEGLRLDAEPVDAPLPNTESAGQPVPGQITGFGAAPTFGEAPAVPVAAEELAPQTFGELSTTDVDTNATPTEEPIQTVETSDTPKDLDQAAAVAPPVAVVPVDTEPDDLVVAQARISIVEDPLIVERPEPEVDPTQDQAPSGEMPRRLVMDSAQDPAEIADPETEEAAAPETPARALEEFGAPYQNAENLPLLAIVLLDTTDAEVDRDSLSAFDFPVTFAIDPTRADAAEIAAAYRAAGHEVIALADALPQGGTPQDIEVALLAARQAMPPATALLDRAENGMSGNSAELDAVLPALAETGMGFLAYSSGLNSGVTRALRDGVPATTIYRNLDGGGERAPIITRYLDRATFEASQNGTAVVIGSSSVEMVTALYTWRLGSRAGQVAMAPLSAVLLATQDDQ